MGQHGFARDLPFAVVAQSADAVTLRLTDGPETRAHYPFAFRLDVAARVRPAGLDLDVTVDQSRRRRPCPTRSGSTRPSRGPSRAAPAPGTAATRWSSSTPSARSPPRSGPAACCCATSSRSP